MDVTFVGKQVQIGDRERELAQKKLQRLSRYFNSTRDARVTYSMQRNQHILEVQLDLDGVLLRAEERTPDFSTAVDGVVEKL
ncbi:MAG TPA: ribosome-associated translation inhibitor RaiA, partial [Armatimonadota bacterium]|nr:ribosome-associated translation inhibitor RaiA [Armatimonadota bacterium]